MNKLKELTKNHYDSVMAVRGEISETLKKYSLEIKVESEEYYDDNNYGREYKVTSIGSVLVDNEDFRYHNGGEAEKMYKALTLIHSRHPEVLNLSCPEKMYNEICKLGEVEDLANEVDYEGENLEDSLLIACICYTHKMPPEEFYELLEFIAVNDSNLLPAEVCED